MLHITAANNDEADGMCGIKKKRRNNDYKQLNNKQSLLRLQIKNQKCLTFNMSGGGKWAKPACGRQLDGRVRPLAEELHAQTSFYA